MSRNTVASIISMIVVLPPGLYAIYLYPVLTITMLVSLAVFFFALSFAASRAL